MNMLERLPIRRNSAGTRYGVLAIYLSAMASVFSPSSPAQSRTSTIPDANPARPTVSTPATLTPVGYLQFENGVLIAKTSPEFSTRLGINQVTKLTVHRRLELILQIEPVVRSLSASRTSLHEGEVFAGAQLVLLSGRGKRPTVSASYIRRLHASVAPEIDIGTFEQSGLILVSGDLLGFHFDANGIVTQQREDRVRRAQFGQTLSISHPLGKFTISGEIWRFSQPFLQSNAVGTLGAVSYPIRKNLVIDAAFNRGLTNTSTQWEVFVGFTYLLPYRLWKERHNPRQ